MLLPQEMASPFFSQPDEVGDSSRATFPGPLGTTLRQTPGIWIARTCSCPHGTLSFLVCSPNPSHSLPASWEDPKFEFLLFQQIRPLKSLILLPITGNLLSPAAVDISIVLRVCAS